MTDSTPSPDPIDQKITYLVTLIRDLATPVLGKATLGSLDKLAARTQTPAVRAIVAGEVSRGKSTLINALIGRPILPDAAGALTSTWTVVQHGPQLMAEATIITPKRRRQAAAVEPAPGIPQDQARLGRRRLRRQARHLGRQSAQAHPRNRPASR